MSDQRGFTVIELLASMAAFVAVFGTITMMTVVAAHNQERVSDRVAANQRARPAMTQIIDALHSSCTAPRVAPVQTGSNNTSISFTSKPGSTVTPLPDLKTVTLSGGTLTMQTRAGLAGGGFSPTVQTSVLATRVTAPSNIVFRYYDYVNGQLSTTPLSTTPSGLSATNAARTSRVAVSLTVAPPEGQSTFDAKSAITLTDAADLRLESAAQLTAQENLPCT